VAVNSRAKGARGEREWAAWLRDELGLDDARRGRQFCGGPESPDVVDGIEGTHAEVKRVEKLNLDNAMKQALNDCGSNIPYVVHRKNGQPWMITVLARDLIAFANCVLGDQEDTP